MFIVKILSLLALIVSSIWLVVSPDYEPVVAVITSLSTLIVFYLKDRKQHNQTLQTQTISERGIGIQAGRDVKMGNINQKDN